MIDKREILEAATALGLNPHVVEKDYMLGWLLWGIYGHDALAESWVFKGGTCLKKCFFETYRFSEDLDFTLTGFGGPTYVYECTYCGKRFRRKKQTTSLNPHKDKSGYPCPGRYGHWVDTQY